MHRATIRIRLISKTFPSLIILKKRQIQNTALVTIALAIIGSIVWYGYSVEQTRQAGFVFGNELLAIQEGIKDQQIKFISHVTQWEDGDLTGEEFEEFANTHFEEMADLIAKYDELLPPKAFETSVNVFRLSAESQLESDKEYLMWIMTGDDSHMIRSDALIQESFEYETAALGEFNRAKLGIE